MKIRIADPLEDALEILEAAQDFVSRMDYVDCFPKDPIKFAEALSNVVMAEYVEIAVAEHEGKIVGMLVMAYLPHVWNHDLLHAEEVMWWAAEDAPKTTGMRLLKFIKRRAKEKGADVLTFTKLTSSPEKVGAVYERLGLREIETSYTGLI